MLKRPCWNFRQKNSGVAIQPAILKSSNPSIRKARGNVLRNLPKSRPSFSPLPHQNWHRLRAPRCQLTLGQPPEDEACPLANDRNLASIDSRLDQPVKKIREILNDQEITRDRCFDSNDGRIGICR
jgi:hypothetical protein